MKLEHSFTVPVGIDEAWKILLDIERIGPCMPGAAVETVDGDDFTGTVKVKLGPIGLTYKGKASFIEKDEAAHRAVIDARGRDARGNGTASAKVTATLTDKGGETHVEVHTDLDITGKPAQFGRGVMVDVGNKLIGQFADNLSHEIAHDRTQDVPETSEPAADTSVAAESAASGSAASESAAQQPPEAASAESGPTATVNGSAPQAGAAAQPAADKPRQSSRPQRDVEPINLIEHAGPAVAKRLAPLVVALLVLVFVLRRRSK